MNQTLIIVRHAHRNKPPAPGPDIDNGLSSRGRVQAKKAAKFYKKRFGKRSTVLLSSPKKRCLETLEPLSRVIHKQIEVLDALDEAQRAGALRQNVNEFIRYWKRSKAPLTVICSHGDWIPEYLKSVAGQSVDLAKGGWAQIERRDDGNESLTWLIQDLDFL